MTPTTPISRSWRDAAAITVLLACAAVLARPILWGGELWGGGWATYLDNPAHVAELASLARGEAWCTEAFCGFPVHLLHAPLAYGLLARLVAFGVPLDLAYRGALALGFVATPLAVYAVSRRRVGPAVALVPAWLLLVQPNGLNDLGAPLGGMWTFHLACAGLVLLADAVARPGPRRTVDVVRIALLLGFIANLHWMTITAAALLAVTALALRPAAHRTGPDTLRADALAASIGALLAAPHWVPTLLARAGMAFNQQNLEPAEVAARLLAPTDLYDLWRGTSWIAEGAWYLDVLPPVALVALGVWGGWTRREEALAALVSRWSLLVLVLLVVVAPTHRVEALGPLPWRFLWVVQIGLALCLLDVRLPRGRASAVVAAVAAVLSCWLWGRPLAAATPRAADLAAVEQLWQWLREHRAEVPGRVYLQSTMGTAPHDSLWRSQILARTASETGVETLGAWYGITHFATGAWTPGEFGRLFRLPMAADTAMGQVIYRMKRTNCSHLVISDPTLAPMVERYPAFTQVARFRRFVVYSRKGPEGWASSLGAGEVLVTRRVPGRFELEVTTEEPIDVIVREAWHPFWTVSGPAVLTEASDGLMVLRVERTGTIGLSYQPPFGVTWGGGFGTKTSR